MIREYNGRKFSESFSNSEETKDQTVCFADLDVDPIIEIEESIYTEEAYQLKKIYELRDSLYHLERSIREGKLTLFVKQDQRVPFCIEELDDVHALVHEMYDHVMEKVRKRAFRALKEKYPDYAKKYLR